MTAFVSQYCFETNYIATSIILPLASFNVFWVWSHPEALEDGVGCGCDQIIGDDHMEMAMDDWNATTTHTNGGGENETNTKSITAEDADDDNATWDIHLVVDEDEDEDHH